MNTKTYILSALLLCALLVTGCSGNSAPSNIKPVVFFSVTTDGKSEDAQRLDMAMKLAGFSLDEDRKVVIFFNVKGVNVPTKDFPADFEYKDQPIKEQLEKLIERGADVHVCPVCMKALNVSADDLIKGAHVTTRPKLFAKIGPGTTVFTY